MKKPSRYLPFKKAREYARSLGLSTQDDWIAFIRGEIPELGKKPSRIPDLPQKIYSRNEWLGYEDWLRKPPSWRPFKEAREYARTLELKSRNDWEKFIKGKLPDLGTKPYDIPDSPARIYRKKGWSGMPDWLGTKSRWRQFEEARVFARKLKLSGESEWRQYCKGFFPGKGVRPNDIPSIPRTAYRNAGWISWGDFLGTGNIAANQKSFKSFEDARTFARRLKLNGGLEWKQYCKGNLQGKGIKPDDIPFNPDRTYKNAGWISWGDFLGTGRIACYYKVFISFKKARKFVRTLKFKGGAEWRQYCKGNLPEKGIKPENIPSNPDRIYRSTGWISWGNWFGTKTVFDYRNNLRSFSDARKFVRALRLKNYAEWRLYCNGKLSDMGKKPLDIPAFPDVAYKLKGWIDWYDWLGKDRACHVKNFRPFDNAREFARSLKLKSVLEWQRYSAGRLPKKGVRPPDIPATPAVAYKNEGWVSWGDWLDSGNVSNINKSFKPFKEARKFARSLNLHNCTDWVRYCEGKMPEKDKRPPDIPSSPDKKYKNTGWKSMSDWLGVSRP